MTRLILGISTAAAIALMAIGDEAGIVIGVTAGVPHVFGASNPIALVTAGLIAFAYWVAAADGIGADTSRGAGLLRRSLAYLVDFVLATTALPALLALPLLWAEAARTGVFRWTVERTQVVPMDVWLGLPLVLGFIVSLNLYFAYPLTRGTQTIGCRLVGIRIVDYDGAPIRFGRAVVRSFVAFLAACAFFVTLPLAFIQRRRGLLWYDQVLDTMAVRLAGSGPES